MEINKCECSCHDEGPDFLCDQCCQGTNMGINELAKQITTWADDTFGMDNRVGLVVPHLLEEVKELAKTPADPLEMADVIMLVFQLAHFADVNIEDALRLKLKINKTRQWTKDNITGAWRHEKSSECCCTFRMPYGNPDDCPVHVLRHLPLI